MKLNNHLTRSFCALLTVTILGAASLATASAKQGATDPIPGTSKGATNTGGAGGGKKSSTTTVTPTPVTPVVPVSPTPTPSTLLSFSNSVLVYGVVPAVVGSYHIDPYYPTLSLMTVDVNCSSVNLPDGSALYVKVNGTGGTLYPFTSNVILIGSQTGICSHSVYVTPGTVITSVDIVDASGAIISSGK